MALGLALLLLAVAILGGVASRSCRKRRAELANQALHELRRPLQSIALALSAPAPEIDCARACLEQAVDALDRIDAAVNGRRRARRISSTTLPELVAALERRWRHRGVEVLVPRGATTLAADPLELGAALDNLVANSLTHGSGPVSVRAFATAGGAHVEVRDGGPRLRSGSGPDDRRHGHGLLVAAEAAAGHGGSLTLARPTRGGGTVAALSLPCDGTASPARSAQAPAA